MRRWLQLFLAGLMALLVSGCLYEQAITRREVPGAPLASPRPERYGTLQFTLVQEYRKPSGFWRFPDGGRAFYEAQYYVVEQLHGDQRREIARLPFTPVRRGDFGNLGPGRFEWAAPDRLTYRVEYGYTGSLRKLLEGEVTVPPLP
jgi:hypothetical protein